MTQEFFTNAYGVKFYIEPAGDFDDLGRSVVGRGFFAGLVQGRDQLSGVFFETKDMALSAIARYVP